MATTEQPRDRLNAVTRSRSARLADQAATAALYVTRPDRRLSVREPSTADTQLFKDLKPTPDLSHASAGAVLAHAKSKPIEIWRPGKLPAAEKAAFHVQDYRPPELPPPIETSPEGYKAALSVVKDRRTSEGLKHDVSGTEQTTAQGPRRPSDHDKALLAATGAFRSNRKRASTSPIAHFEATNPTAPAAEEEPLEHLDSANEASRIHHIANANARLYTSTPPVSIEAEEQKKKNVLRAAALSMARDMYNITESGDAQRPDAAVYAAQRGNSRSRPQRTVSKTDPGALQRALSLQDAAQKRAAEKLALMHDETAAYQNYYGTAPQPARSTLVRKRRTSSDTDTSKLDVERSMEIRNQMSSLRTKLNAVDEQREKDRLLLMEAARRNVDAAIHDMELKVYAETGRAPSAMQKEWEEAAQERARQELQIQETEARLVTAKVNIGAEQFMDMADVEAVARSRVQPTIDEITDRAEEQRAKDLEARLDQEEKDRREAVERQREADTRAEEKRQREADRQEAKEKEEKSWLWRRKSKRQSREKEAPVDHAPVDHAPVDHAPVEQVLDGQAVGDVEQPPAETTLPETTEQDNAVAASGAVAVDSGEAATSPRTESKLKSWFRGRKGRRSSGNARETAAEAEEEGDKEPSFTGGAALAARDDTRGAALSSHPPAGDDTHRMPSVGGNSLEHFSTAEDRQVTKEKPETNGEHKRSRLRSSFMKIVSRGSQEHKTNGVSKHEVGSRRGSEAVEGTEKNTTDIQRSTAAEREGLRDSAAEQGLPLPPAIAKRTSNNSTARGSRFSEDL